MPDTSNGLESLNADAKAKQNLHKAMSKERRKSVDNGLKNLFNIKETSYQFYRFVCMSVKTLYYLCNVKNRVHIRLLSFLLLYVCATGTYGQGDSGKISAESSSASSSIDSYGILSVEEWDSVEISLLTCDPHQEIYSLYGHTAIRVKDNAAGTDFVIDYGVFNLNKPYFALNFTFGTIDYEMGIYPFKIFHERYGYEGRQVVEQILNLTKTEKQRLVKALKENWKPENRTFRYNIFYDNCTTRARDIIVKNLDGAVDYLNENKEFPSFRHMLHVYTADHPWAQFGNDMLLGVKADSETNESEHQFLPDYLRIDFGKAVVIPENGKSRKLVKNTSIIIPSGIQVTEKGFPLSPLTCAIILAVVTIALSIMEWLTKRRMWLFDLLLMIAAGLAGVVLTMMIFSQHPTVSLNLLIFMLNPLLLIFAWPVIRNLRKGKGHWFWWCWVVLIGLTILGHYIQDYPRAMTFVALSLFVRSIINSRLKT